MNKLPILIVSIAVIVTTACSEKKPLTLANSSAERILVSLTLEEKTHLLADTHQQEICTTYPIPRLGIPSITIADGSSGRSTFPISISLASTWNTELITSVGEAMGYEALKCGVDVLCTPALHINRHLMYIQNNDSFSEDPVLSGQMASAMVQGIQSTGVGASLKYFGVNDPQRDIRLTPRALREIYLKPFEIAVRQSQPWTITTSSNSINGIQSSESTGLLRTLLRNEWHYDGVVLSRIINENMIASLRAGTDLPMPENPEEYNNILAALNNGTLKMADINRNITNILKLISKTPVLKGSLTSDNPEPDFGIQIIDQDAAEGIVLLKNDKQTLPIDSKVENIAIYTIGEIIPSAGELARQARTADVALVHWAQNKSLYNKELQTICNAFHAAGKKVIVILQTEGVMETASWKNLPDAILLTWSSGQDLENIIADVLYGRANPSGKLPVTFPVNYADIPFSANHFSDTENYSVYGEDIYVGYRYFDSFRKEVSYPFGYGLSYTSFKYENAAIREENNQFIVTVDITNTGKYSGKEVVQLYISAPINLDLNKPLKELKAFAKTKELAPGEKQTLTLRVNKKDLASFNEEESKWIVDTGNYKFLLGSSLQDIRLFVDAEISESIETTVNNILLPREPITVLIL